MERKKVSVIIPVKEINDYIRAAMPHYRALDYPDFELLIFPDEATGEQLDGACIIPSGKVGPAEKRDLALQYAAGDIFAFTDDDAYPRADWLKNAVAALEPEEVGAVGGPAVTAPEDDLLQRAGGLVYESSLCSGQYTYRYRPGKPHEDDDIPSVNLVVKRAVFAAVGGYDSTFYPGEDTKLCLDIVNSGKKILYRPEVLVYHHRRPLFRPHLRQLTNYAKHRGYFARVLPQTSLRFQYFVPTLFAAGVLLGPVVCALLPFLWYIYTGVLLLYFLLAALTVKNAKSLPEFLLALAGIFASHIAYGICFVKGLCSKEMLR